MILTDFFPSAGTDGRSAYLLDIINYLVLNGFEIKLCVLSDTPNGTVPWYLMPKKLATVDVRIINNYCWGHRFFIRFNFRNWFLALPCIIYRRLPMFLHNSLEKILNRQRREVKHFLVKNGSSAFVNELLKAEQPEVIIFNYARLTRLKEELSLPTDILTGVITHDVVHHRKEMMLASRIIANTDEMMSKDEERKALSEIDFIIAIQEEDAAIFRQMLPKSTVITAPMSTGFTTDTIIPIKRIVHGRCLLVGGYGQPNIDSFNWFLREVWPRVYARNPELSLHVCGNVCRALFAPEKMNVLLRGRVENLEEEYIQAELCVIPLRAGSGLKIKLIEALKYNCRCVSTSCGVQGIHVPEKYGITVADSVDAMVEAILSLTQSNIVNNNNSNSFLDDFSPRKCHGDLIDFIRNHSASN